MFQVPSGLPLCKVALLLGIALVRPSPCRAEGPAATRTQAAEPGRTSAVSDLMRYEATGLSLLRPYVSGKIPVVFVHGLWCSPSSWEPMIADLQADPRVDGRYQFWTFGYSTGDPIPYSALLLRRDLDEVRRKVDPERSDPAFSKMVMVGHSMGGLLVKMMSVESGTGLWRAISDRPIEDLKGETADRDFFRGALFFEARPEVRRVVFIATPHRGSHFDRGPLHHAGTRLVRLPGPLVAVHHRLIEQNDRAFFKDHFRKGLPSSIDELEWDSPMLTGLHKLSVSPAIKYHSIIAVRPVPAPIRPIRTDGLVTYDSAHVDGALSEKIVAAGHLCQAAPDVIGEVRRILAEHASPDRME